MSSSSTGKPSYRQCWIAETVRLHERRHGRLDDSHELTRLRDDGGPVDWRIVQRALALAERTGLDQAVQQWQTGLRWGGAGVAAVAVVTGFGAALAVLGDSQAQVNIVWTLAALLGFNLLMLVFWLVGIVAAGRSGGGALGRAWLLLARLAGGSGRGTAARAFLSLGTGSDVHRWMLSAVTHGFWCLSTLAVILALLIALSLRAYDFVWETTILSSGVFVQFVQWSAWLPSVMGFAIPDESMVRASELAVGAGNEESLRRAWSSWLVGCLVVYGLLPRLFLFLCSVSLLLLRMRRCRLATRSAEWAALAARLSPASAPGQVVDPDTQAAGAQQLQLDPLAVGEPVMVALELGRDISWPPAGTTEALGPADDRDRRHEVEHRLRERRPARLLAVVDARLSPDRGLMNGLLTLSATSADAGVWLMQADEAGGERLDSWRQSLKQAGFPSSRSYVEEQVARQWLTGGAGP
ncbi:MAG: DUF2868 domain-containing protein [Pseudohongiellaceae bacterium]